MNSVICKRLEVLHQSDIETMSPGTLHLKEGKSFVNIPLEENAIYLSVSRNENAGTLVTETLTAKTKYNEALLLILQYYVLRLYTDSGSFLVGSLDYPCELTHSNDKIFVNLSFKAVSPA